MTLNNYSSYHLSRRGSSLQLIVVALLCLAVLAVPVAGLASEPDPASFEASNEAFGDRWAEVGGSWEARYAAAEEAATDRYEAMAAALDAANTAHGERWTAQGQAYAAASVASARYAAQTAFWGNAAERQLASNPELIAARRYAKEAEARALAAYLAANPEVNMARNYVAGATIGTQAAFFAANPEVNTARNYVRDAAGDAEAAFLAANPEVRQFRSYVPPTLATFRDDLFCCLTDQ